MVETIHQTSDHFVIFTVYCSIEFRVLQYSMMFAILLAYLQTIKVVFAIPKQFYCPSILLTDCISLTAGATLVLSVLRS